DGIGALTFYLKQGEYGDLDLTVPVIAIETPLDDIANANGFIVTGMATDNLAVEHVEVTVSDLIKGVHRVMASYDDVSMQWQASILAEWISVGQVNSGQTTIVTATAVDYALNATSNSRDFIITEDIEPPVVTITSHQNQDAVNVTGFTVLGTVTDDIDVATITATVTDPVLGQTVIDQPLNISSLSGQWAFPITNGRVSNNAQITISLLATDVNGKTAQATLFVNSLQISTNPVQLVQRITFGLTPDLLARVKRGDDILNEQLAPDSIDDSVFEAQMAAMPIFQGADLRNYLTTYMTHSKKQLREVMAWFWENHFNTNLNTHGFVQYELRENNWFREQAVGSVRDWLA
ncbi:MAG: DUF1800 domain-containing protein, partial [Psychrosphaera sp.]|nr:DUF1800 domain-containing protein [Psychrosphaera sp.]